MKYVRFLDADRKHLSEALAPIAFDDVPAAGQEVELGGLVFVVSDRPPRFARENVGVATGFRMIANLVVLPVDVKPAVESPVTTEGQPAPQAAVERPKGKRQQVKG